MKEIIGFLVIAVCMVVASSANAQTVVTPPVVCPAGFTYNPTSIPPSCVPTVVVDPNAAAAAAVAAQAAQEASAVAMQQELLQQELQAMRMRRMFEALHPGPHPR